MGIIDTIGSFLGDISLDKVGTALDIGSKVAGAFGQAKGGTTSTPSQVAGYAGLPPEVQKYLMDSVLPQIQAQATAPRVSVPFRRADATDYDPIFGSKARVALQDYYDRKAVGDEATKAETAKEAAKAEKAIAPANSSAQLAATMQRLRMLGGNPETDMSADAKAYRQNLHDLMVMKDMDGYKNEYTGGVFDLTDYLNNMNTALDERAMMGNGGGIVDYSTPAYTKATNAYSQQRDNALRRPKEMDLIAPLVAAAITGGVGLWGAPAAASSLVGAGKAASTALGLGQRLAGK
jgi:hypothetical protein